MSTSEPAHPAIRLGVALAALVVVLPQPAAAQHLRSAPKRPAARYSDARFGTRPPRPPRPLTPAATSRVTVVESEPNDSIRTADTVALGDTISGSVTPAGDVDYFTLVLTAGTVLDLDVDASQVGSPLDPIMALIDSTGMTVLAFDDDTDGLDSRIRYSITVSGRYYVGIAGYASSGGQGYFYRLKLNQRTPGPGDPTTLYATGLGSPFGIAAGATGELYVADPESSRVLRVAANRSVATLARLANWEWPLDVVVDGPGDVLVAVQDSSGAGTVMRIVPGRAPSVFARGMGPIQPITVGPDADVWVGDSYRGWLRRFDPTGVPKDSIPVTDGVYALAFSPAGDLHFSNGYDRVYRLVGRTAEVVIQANPYLEGLAFDRDGYLYVANGYAGVVDLYSPSYQRVSAGFAITNLGGPIALAFGRTPTGAMSARLFAANVGYSLSGAYVGSVVELNPAGIRAPGWRVGADLLRVSTTALRPGFAGVDYADTLRVANPPGTALWTLVRGTVPQGLILGPTGVLSGVPEDSSTTELVVRVDAGGQFGYGRFILWVYRPEVNVTDAANALLGATDVLSSDVQRYLDLRGNRNGRYDVGDLRAYLRSRNQLPTGAAPRAAVAAEVIP